MKDLLDPYPEMVALLVLRARDRRSPSVFQTKKLVAASTPALEPHWANGAVIGGDLARFVTELKRQPGADIGVHGSIALTQSLLEAGLVDELRLVVAPAIQVHGRKLFAKGMPRRLTVTRNVTSPAGYLLVDARFER